MGYNDLALAIIEGAINEVRFGRDPCECQIYLIDVSYDWLSIMGYGINKQEWKKWVQNRCDKEMPLTFHRKS